ncbi:MAG: hypothetical protein MZV64_12455 [Ignavibacteriales bacterium]|nr:hypothetical protein [Ignavibacteriales bacterium]
MTMDSPATTSTTSESEGVGREKLDPLPLFRRQQGAAPIEDQVRNATFLALDANSPVRH